MKVPVWVFGLVAGVLVWYFWCRGRGDTLVYGRVPGSGLPGMYDPSGLGGAGSLSGGEAPGRVQAPDTLGQTNVGSR